MAKKLILSGCLIINEKNEILLLFRKDHKHYETPGGKVPHDNPSLEQLKNSALREAYEELGNDIKLAEPKYFGKTDFIIPDGRRGIANKFMTRLISGTPKVNEPEIFSKFAWLSIETLKEQPISPDLKLLADKLRTRPKKSNI